jgi:hypothetical protein
MSRYNRERRKLWKLGLTTKQRCVRRNVWWSTRYRPGKLVGKYLRLAIEQRVKELSA